ncbi:MAG: hypothetical protein WC782_11700 [Methylococcaceae bacterium]|jgi:hypothetical protein
MVPAWSHMGPHHSEACFIKIGDATLELNGYQFQKELAGKYFCHIFPGLGLTVLAIDSTADQPERQQVGLTLKALTAWSKLGLDTEHAFTVLQQTPMQTLGANLVSVEQSMHNRGVYVLDIAFQETSAAVQTHRFWFLVGIPVTKALVFIGIIFLLPIIWVALKSFKKAKFKDAL